MLRGERGSVRAVLRPSPARTPHARAARARAPQTARVTARAHAHSSQAPGSPAQPGTQRWAPCGF